jgi:hypothetical protein
MTDLQKILVKLIRTHLNLRNFCIDDTDMTDYEDLIYMEFSIDAWNRFEIYVYPLQVFCKLAYERTSDKGGMIFHTFPVGMSDFKDKLADPDFDPMTIVRDVMETFDAVEHDCNEHTPIREMMDIYDG